jgi:predicted ATPase
MSPDGADVAAALQTIRETGDADALDQAIDLAFPGTIELVKDFGETRVAGQEPLGGPAWRWPKR